MNRECELGEYDVAKGPEDSRREKAGPELPIHKGEPISAEERTLLESIVKQKEKRLSQRKKRTEEIKGRERANSLSILNFLKENTMDNVGNINKRKREEAEKGINEVFKKSNKISRTPPSEQKGDAGRPNKKDGDGREEEEQMKEGENVIITFLREIKSDLAEMRAEMKETQDKTCYLENGWEVREKKMKERMNKLEARVGELKSQGKDKKEYNKTIAEEVTKKVIETWKNSEKHVMAQEIGNVEQIRKEVMKLKKIMEEKERMERKNKIVIRGLKSEKKEVKEVGIDFLQKEFNAGNKVKNARKTGKELRAVIIIELENWQDKENIMKMKSKLRGRHIFIDHDLAMEEREVQRKF